MDGKQIIVKHLILKNSLWGQQVGITGSVPPGYTRVGLVAKHVLGKEIRTTASEDRTCSQLRIYAREENCHPGLQLQLLFCEQGGCELPSL